MSEVSVVMDGAEKPRSGRRRGANSFRISGERASVRIFLKLGLMDRFPEAAKRDIAAVIGGKLYDFAPGEKICTPGDRAGSAWMLISGTVLVKDRAGANIGRWCAPCLFGEEAIITNDGRYLYDVTAADQVSVAELTESAVQKIVEIGGAGMFWRNMSGVLSKRVSNRCVSTQQFIAVEHRAVVVMFTDVIGFSNIAASLSPIETGQFLSDVMSKQSLLIERRGGKIDRIMGDGLMAYWNITPSVPRAMACKLALAGATEIVSSISGVANPANLQDSVRLRIGLHVGEAAYGDFVLGRIGGTTLIGDAVNIACRMEQAKISEESFGRLGYIRCSEDFYFELDIVDRGELPYEAFVTIKGKAFKILSGPSWAGPTEHPES